MHAFLLAVHRRLEHEDLEHLKGKVLVFLPAEFIKRYNMPKINCMLEDIS
jgi:hypothetical protein